MGEQWYSLRWAFLRKRDWEDMQRGDEGKARLFTTWFEAHRDTNIVPLFSAVAPQFVLIAAAPLFFARPERAGLYLYMLLAKSLHECYPLYIGKTTSPRKRWLQGHLRHLRQARSGAQVGSYSRWVQVLETLEGQAYLFCIHECAITSAPLPGFPMTIGSIEYQLVSLASDAFPGRLFNSEGRGR
jgi:hypothetical protein